MDYLNQLQQYFKTATPEQLEQDYQELASYGENSPTIDEYLQDLNVLPQMNIINSYEINPEIISSGFFY